MRKILLGLHHHQLDHDIARRHTIAQPIAARPPAKCDALAAQNVRSITRWDAVRPRNMPAQAV